MFLIFPVEDSIFLIFPIEDSISEMLGLISIKILGPYLGPYFPANNGTYLYIPKFIYWDLSIDLQCISEFKEDVR